MRKRLNKLQFGFSLTELLVAIAIAAVLFILLALSIRKPLEKAQDARAVKEMRRLKVAFEEYYNDNYCYPPASWFDGPEDCNSTQFRPYLDQIQCDRKTGLPYEIEYDATTCDWFKIYTNLHYRDDALCAASGNSSYNYGLSSDNVAVTIDCDALDATPSPSPAPSSSPVSSPSPTPTPTPSPSPSPSPGEGDHYCQAIGDCQFYNNTVWTCTPNYFTTNCDGECSFRTGSCILD